MAALHSDDADDCTDIPDAEEQTLRRARTSAGRTTATACEVTATNPAPTFDIVVRYSAITARGGVSPRRAPGHSQTSAPDISVTPRARRPTRRSATRCTPSTASPRTRPATAGSTRRRRLDRVPVAALRRPFGTDCNEIPARTRAHLHARRRRTARTPCRCACTGTNEPALGPADLAGVVRRHLRARGGRRPDTRPTSRAAPPKSQAPTIARQRLRRRDAGRHGRRLEGPDHGLPAPLGALRRRRQRVHLHPGGGEHRPRGRLDLRRARRRRRLHDPHARDRRRNARPDRTDAAGNVSAPLRVSFRIVRR